MSNKYVTIKNPTHSQIIGMSDDQLKFILKNDDPDCETHDTIDKELYYRGNIIKLVLKLLMISKYLNYQLMNLKGLVFSYLNKLILKILHL